MNKPDFTPASHPFKANAIEWCEDVVHLGFGDLLVEQAMTLAQMNAKKENRPCTVTREQLRFWAYDMYAKQGWDKDALLRMGFKPIVGDWRATFPARQKGTAK